MRVLHFSDIHVHEGLDEAPLRSFAGKRLLGALNLELLRRGRFAHATEKVSALASFAREQNVELVLMSGDYTALGTEGEMRVARACVAPLFDVRHGYVTLPGNHDLYLRDSLDERRFERHFGPLLTSDRPDLATDGPWPLVRLAGSDVAVVAVNSARPNPQPWRSSGRVPDAQLDGLRRALCDERIASRFVFVMTHYAPLRPDGRPDTRLHGLDNAVELLAAATELRRGCVVHGHIHWRYRLDRQGTTPAMFGAGSATYEGREGFWLFEVAAGTARAFPGRVVRDGHGWRCIVDREAGADV